MDLVSYLCNYTPHLKELSAADNSPTSLTSGKLKCLHALLACSLGDKTYFVYFTSVRVPMFNPSIHAIQPANNGTHS